MSVDNAKKSGISSWCKDCRKYTAKNWHTKYPDRSAKQAENKQAPTYEKMRDYMLKHRYGISQEIYNSMLEKQNHSCAICKKKAEDLTYLLHVDHCHTTEKVRGLLCSACNLYVGYVKNNLHAFENGMNYLKE
jgi:nitrate/TMAO reductase-like tetraheme cytochrome c subunit